MDFNNTNVKLTGSDVAKYNNRLYSILWVNKNYGYFLAPINSPREDLGFWASREKCTLLSN